MPHLGAHREPNSGWRAAHTPQIRVKMAMIAIPTQIATLSALAFFFTCLMPPSWLQLVSRGLSFRAVMFFHELVHVPPDCISRVTHSRPMIKA